MSGVSCRKRCKIARAITGGRSLCWDRSASDLCKTITSPTAPLILAKPQSQSHQPTCAQAAVPAAPGSEKKKRRKKGGRGERDGDTAAAAAPEGGAPTLSMRIVSYFGHWICSCGKESALWDTCACGQVPSNPSRLPFDPKSRRDATLITISSEGVASDAARMLPL